MTTYSQAIDLWLDSRLALADVLPYTAERAAQKARLFLPYFGEKEIDDIKAIDIESAIIALMKKGGRNGKGLSKSTMRQAHMHGSKAIEWAIDHEFATFNPFDRVKRPKGAKPKSTALEQEQAEHLMDCAMRELESATLGFYKPHKIARANYCMFVVIALSTGMRRGEICGLQWSDIEDSYISIKQAIKADGEIGEPKNTSSIRRVAIGKKLSNLLKAFNIWQSEFRPKRDFGEFNPVLCDIDGNRMSQNSLEHWWKEFVHDAGFDGLRIHDMRHTHATLLIASGVDVKTVQTRLGHSSADMTLNVYSHAVPRNDEKAASGIDEMLFAKGAD